MHHVLAPIPCKPWSLNGLSERLIVSHYENDYGGAVRHLNAIRDELGSLDLAALPAHRLRGLKREELDALNSVLLHELYFGTLGGDGAARFTGTGIGTPMDEQLSAGLTRDFGSSASWRREFVSLAGALAHGSGWVLLDYSRREQRLCNVISVDHSHAMVHGTPLLALDMYEHAYHLDFGSNASAYIDAFMRNIDWKIVAQRLVDASGGRPGHETNQRADELGSISVDELSAALAAHERIQLVDVRPKHYFSRTTDMMSGAVWRDPDRIDEWSRELSSDATLVVYCAYGYSVGCGVAETLRDRGLDAKYLRGGLSAWNAAGGERTLKPRDKRA